MKHITGQASQRILSSVASVGINKPTSQRQTVERQICSDASHRAWRGNNGSAVAGFFVRIRTMLLVRPNAVKRPAEQKNAAAA
jgi:hypothetical protein